MAISAVGAPVKNSGTLATTLSVTPTAIGNVWLLSVAVGIKTQSATTAISGVTGGGVAASGSGQPGAWQLIAGNVNVSTQTHIEVWMGTVTSGAGQASTITITISPAQASDATNGLVVQEFTAGTGPATTWALDGAAGSKQNTTSSATVSFPTLTPSGLLRMYFGYAWVSGNGQSSGQTAGYTVILDGKTNPVLYNPNVTGAQSPAASQDSGTSYAFAALIVSSVPRPPPSMLKFPLVPRLLSYNY